MSSINLFDLYAKITLDTAEYEKGMDEARGKSSTFFDTLKANLTSQAIVGGLKTLGSAAGNMVKTIGGAYADYEQLVGGVETLFKTSSEKVLGYAEGAYQTAGMSANEYMETVTSFSASLLQSLEGDTDRAADYANQAITDMSDNANKMGTDISMIQNAYQGFAKQNFTMLDNLKLGYGGTKEEMGRLLIEAEKISGIEYDISSYADIVDAIHVVQTEMGITGTTAAEASKTISGSVAAAKSAWENFLTGIADENADLDALLGRLLESVATAAGNIIPRVGVILESLGGMVTENVPKIVEGFAQGLTERFPVSLDAGVGMLNSFVDGVLAGIPDMVARIPEVVDRFVTFISDNAPRFLEAGADILSNLITGIITTIPELVKKIPEIITAFVTTIRKNLPKIIETGFNILMKLGEGIFDALPELVADLPEVGAAILNGFTAALSGIFDIGVDIVKGLWEGIQSMAGWIGEKVTGFFNGLFDEVKENEEIHSPSKKWAFIGEYDALGFGTGWDKAFRGVKDRITDGLDFGTASVDFASSGLGISSAGIVNGVSSAMAGNHGGGYTMILQLPDNTELARYYLPGFIDVAKANGTPIANPVTA